MRIKKIRLENFRAFNEFETELSTDVAFIEGKNGTGKTTILESFLWVFADKDYSLISSPAIRNVLDENAKDLIVLAELTLDINGVDVIVSKSQKMSVSKAGVVRTSNEYLVNGVPKTERDFKEYFEEKGYSFDHLLNCVHTDMFSSKKQADMRVALFEMVGDITDLEIADNNEELSELKPLLENYKLEEITAMNKATKKKAEDNVKDIPAKIQGLDSARITIDTNAIESEIADKRKQIEDIDNKLNADKENEGRIAELEKDCMDIKFEISDFEKSAFEELVNAKAEYEKVVNAEREKYYEKKQKYDSAFQELNSKKLEYNTKSRELSILEEEYKTEKEKVFDDSELVCRLCKRPLDLKTDLEKMRLNFKAIQQGKMNEIIEKAKVVRKEKDELFAITEEKQAELDKLNKDFSESCRKLKINEQRYNALPTKTDLSDNQTLNEMKDRLKRTEDELSELKNASNEKDYATEKEWLLSEIERLSKELGKDNNLMIDEKIKNLEETRLDLEQTIADCEKILYLVKELSKAKNEMLVEKINSHFEKVKWKLFEYQKNGEYKEVCVPMIDGYSIYTTANTQRRICAKIDICNSFQKFYNEEYPILLDCGESLNNKNIPKVDTQLVIARVTEDALRVK